MNAVAHRFLLQSFIIIYSWTSDNTVMATYRPRRRVIVIVNVCKSQTHGYICLFVVNKSFFSNAYLVPEILGQTDPLPSKTPIFNRFSLVDPL